VLVCCYAPLTPTLLLRCRLKNSSQEELKGDTLTRHASQAKEKQWFESEPRAAAYKGQSARLGVGQLETALTELLVNQIEKAIPTMCVLRENDRFPPTFDVKAMIFPRQARDKHRENSNQRTFPPPGAMRSTSS
jgi:hypothetical protein